LDKTSKVNLIDRSRERFHIGSEGDQRGNQMVYSSHKKLPSHISRRNHRGRFEEKKPSGCPDQKRRRKGELTTKREVFGMVDWKQNYTGGNQLEELVTTMERIREGRCSLYDYRNLPTS